MLCFGWAFLMIWRILKCALSLSKKRHIWHHRLKNGAVSFCPMYHFAPVSPTSQSLVMTQIVFCNILPSWCSSGSMCMEQRNKKLCWIKDACKLRLWTWGQLHGCTFLLAWNKNKMSCAMGKCVFGVNLGILRFCGFHTGHFMKSKLVFVWSKYSNY